MKTFVCSEVLWVWILERMPKELLYESGKYGTLGIPTANFLRWVFTISLFKILHCYLPFIMFNDLIQGVLCECVVRMMNTLPEYLRQNKLDSCLFQLLLYGPCYSALHWVVIDPAECLCSKLTKGDMFRMRSSRPHRSTLPQQGSSSSEGAPEQGLPPLKAHDLLNISFLLFLW